MTNEDRLQQLEALLDRVRRRASEARRPITRLLDAALTRAEPRSNEPAPPPPVREIPREPAFSAAPPLPPPVPAPVEPPPVPAFVPFTVVPATLELVDTPPPEELGEEDVLDEIPSDMLESVPPSGGTVDRDTLDESADEEPPASSQRPRAAALLEDALGEAPMIDEGREVPLKTPPPESGPQEAPIPMGLGSPAAPDLDRLEADLSPAATAISTGSRLDSLEPPFGAVSMPVPIAPGPTVEQLGQTIELEVGGGPSLELDAPATPPPPPPPKSEELEVPLPSQRSAGHYDEELMPPPEARGDLDAHREKVGESRPPEAPSFAELSPSLPASPVVHTMPAIGELPIAEFSPPPGPEIVGRPPLESGVVFSVKPSEQPAKAPTTFLELLDSSITLGG
jgi:hypothetical protein